MKKKRTGNATRENEMKELCLVLFNRKRILEQQSHKTTEAQMRQRTSVPTRQERAEQHRFELH